MNELIRMLVAAVAATGMMTTAQAQTARTASMTDLHVVAYIDLAAKSVDQGLAALAKYRTATRAEAGNASVSVLQEIGRRDRLALVETWQDVKSLDSHGTAASKTRLDSDLKGLLIAPLDSRPHTSYHVGARSSAGRDGVYVLTHVDVPPPQLAALEPLLKEWAQASRQQAGATWLDVLQSPARKNHFTVAEGWKSRAALDTQALSAHARQFRDKLGPMLGALYDQRFYKLVD